MIVGVTLLLLSLAAEPQVGVASNASASAVVIGTAVIAATKDVSLSPQLLDIVSARVMKDHGIDRGSLLLNIPVSKEGHLQVADEIVDAIDSAYRNVRPGKATIENGAVVVSGRRVMELCGVPSTQHSSLSGRPRGVYRVLELLPLGPDPLSIPSRLHRQFPVQVLSFAKGSTIIALSGEPPPNFIDRLSRQISSRNMVITGCRNEASMQRWSGEDAELIPDAVLKAVAAVR